MGNEDRFSKRNSLGGDHSFQRSTCATYGKKHLEHCLSGTKGYFRCSNRRHKMRYCPNLDAKRKEVNQAPYDGPNPNAPKRNCVYALGVNEGTNLE